MLTLRVYAKVNQEEARRVIAQIPDPTPAKKQPHSPEG
jgi:hypothetical protein